MSALDPSAVAVDIGHGARGAAAPGGHHNAPLVRYPKEPAAFWVRRLLHDAIDHRHGMDAMTCLLLLQRAGYLRPDLPVDDYTLACMQLAILNVASEQQLAAAAAAAAALAADGSLAAHQLLRGPWRLPDGRILVRGARMLERVVLQFNELFQRDEDPSPALTEEFSRWRVSLMGVDRSNGGHFDLPGWNGAQQVFTLKDLVKEWCRFVDVTAPLPSASPTTAATVPPAAATAATAATATATPAPTATSSSTSSSSSSSSTPSAASAQSSHLLRPDRHAFWTAVAHEPRDYKRAGLSSAQLVLFLRDHHVPVDRLRPGARADALASPHALDVALFLMDKAAAQVEAAVPQDAESRNLVGKRVDEHRQLRICGTEGVKTALRWFNIEAEIENPTPPHLRFRRSGGSGGGSGGGSADHGAVGGAGARRGTEVVAGGGSTAASAAVAAGGGPEEEEEDILSVGDLEASESEIAIFGLFMPWSDGHEGSAAGGAGGAGGRGGRVDGAAGVAGSATAGAGGATAGAAGSATSSLVGRLPARLLGPEVEALRERVSKAEEERDAWRERYVASQAEVRDLQSAVQRLERALRDATPSKGSCCCVQ